MITAEIRHICRLHQTRIILFHYLLKIISNYFMYLLIELSVDIQGKV